MSALRCRSLLIFSFFRQQKSRFALSSNMDLPPELVLEVLFFLDYSSRLRMLLVSRRHYRLISSQRPQLGLPKVILGIHSPSGTRFWVWTPTHYYRTIRARAVCGAVSAGLVSAGKELGNTSIAVAGVRCVCRIFSTNIISDGLSPKKATIQKCLFVSITG